MGSPTSFFIQYVAQTFISFIELAFFASDRNAELHKQLRNVMDTIAYAVLLFSVVKSAQLSVSDTDLVNKLTLLHFLVFMSDFVSTWFKTYSIYLAGERLSQSTTALENMFTSLWESPLTKIVCVLFSEGYFRYEFVDFNFDSFKTLANQQFGAKVPGNVKNLQDLMHNYGFEFCAHNLKTILFGFMIYRVAVAVIQLKQGMTRIVCLDIEEISAKSSEQKA